MLDQLFLKSNDLIRLNNHKFKRYFIDSKDLSHRLIVILGQRGIGKTTTLAQLASKNKDSLYLSLDDIEISNDITSIIREFVLNGGKHLYLDEIHKSKDISAVLKFAHDSFKELNIVATGSSALEVLKSSHDLSRRAIVYKMSGMSFREYLGLRYGINLEAIELKDLLASHQEMAVDIINALKQKDLVVIKLFREYLKVGYYPYYNDMPNDTAFYQTLRQSIEATIDSDLLSIYPNLNGNTARKLKILTHAISTNVPYQPNYSSLKSLVDIRDDRTLKEYLAMLDSAGLIRLLMKNELAIKNMDKTDKIYLENTNLMYINSPDIGNVRETFFANQLGNITEIYSGKNGDFMVGNNFTFEIGGAKKSFEQIKDMPNSFIAADDIEVGVRNKIPLWLFGFLY
ncbi:ATP-binding protein [Campylobacter curvus]|uniref:ATP-binding protein n=1 Tax=Campylobacter curvus TaxID=200 RepID=UPI0003610B6F|nr:AAA family ATPase [Campylobacter curvus]QKF62153.1 ATP-binding protein (AAA domain) [Campylobacter curvus]UEB50441.1 AAA family ATPase [Campylobacter curvus]